MLDSENGANELSLKDIEAFLSDDGQATPPVENEEEKTPQATQPAQEEKHEEPTEKKSNETTQAFSKRLNEDRERIAKLMGFDTYEAMIKSRENQLLSDKGLDPEEVKPIVDKIVEQRLKEDPRMKELEEVHKEKVQTWAKKELAEITELSGGKITNMSQLSQDVVNLWKQKGSLKAAYLEVEGERLIREARLSAASEQSKGSTAHLNSPEGSPNQIVGGPEKRPLTEKEKSIYKLFNNNLTDEELNKKLVEK
jgi:uncharacterized FlaG/YvyC family protein